MMKQKLALLLAALLLAAFMAGCVSPAETTAPTDPGQTTLDAGGSSESTTPADTSAPGETSAPAETTVPPESSTEEYLPEKEELLSWGGKTLYGYGQGWGQYHYGSADFERGQEEEVVEAAYLGLVFGDEFRLDRLLGSIVIGKDATVLFDIPQEEIEDESGEDGEEGSETAEPAEDPAEYMKLLEESVLLMMQEAQEDAALETHSIGGLSWQIGMAKQSAFEGTAVLNVYAWTQDSDYLVYINVSVVLRGDVASEEALEEARTLMEEWLGALEIQ